MGNINVAGNFFSKVNLIFHEVQFFNLGNFAPQYFFHLQENGILIESMDACFGLSRKKCQGLKSIGVPKHGQLMFADQDDVDNFVNGYCERASEVSKVC